MEYWNAQGENGITGVGIDRGVGHGERPGDLGRLIGGQEANVDVRGNIVLADLMGPYVEECAMAHPREPKSDRIDIAGVPVRSRWNTRVATSAVLVDSGNHTMIPILEADIDGVDMRGRGSGPVPQIPA